MRHAQRLRSRRRLAWACALALAPGAPAQAGPPPRILAREDSLRVYVVPETTVVRAQRVPLSEIVRKAQEGERRKYEGISTLALTRFVKVTLEYGGRKPRTECEERATRIYHRAPDAWASAPLRHAEYVVEAGERRAKDKKAGAVRVEVDADVDADRAARSLTELPEYLRDVDKFRFEIADRHLWPDQVLYEITFAPRSDFEMLPSGRIWLLTRGYKIVREEFRFDRLPLPGILRGVDLVTREWQEVDGHWVPKRITARVALGLPAFLSAPESAEIVVLYDDYRFDIPLDDALFAGRKP